MSCARIVGRAPECRELRLPPPWIVRVAGMTFEGSFPSERGFEQPGIERVESGAATADDRRAAEVFGESAQMRAAEMHASVDDGGRESSEMGDKMAIILRIDTPLVE